MVGDSIDGERNLKSVADDPAVGPEKHGPGLRFLRFNPFLVPLHHPQMPGSQSDSKAGHQNDCQNLIDFIGGHITA